MVLGLERPTAGEVRIDGEVVETARGARRRAIRRAMQPVFQDPYASLDPTYSIEHIVDEPLRVARVGDRASRRRRVGELLDQVALPGSLAQRRPNELSGGQRQRVAIARALALDPRLVVCDEAVSALDVLVQEQTLALLSDLQDRLGLTYLFITHDLAVVRQLADDVLVMQQGRVVERGSVDAVFAAPQTDYTRSLLDAIPGSRVLRRAGRLSQAQTVPSSRRGGSAGRGAGRRRRVGGPARARGRGLRAGGLRPRRAAGAPHRVADLADRARRGATSSSGMRNSATR